MGAGTSTRTVPASLRLSIPSSTRQCQRVLKSGCRDEALKRHDGVALRRYCLHVRMREQESSEHAVQGLQHGRHARFGCTVSSRRPLNSYTRRVTGWLALLLGVCTDPLLTMALGARSKRSRAARRPGRRSTNGVS